MRAIRVGGATVGLALLALSAVVGIVGGSRLAEAQVDQSLTARSVETASAVEEYFERARAIDLMVANTPAFAERFAGPEDSSVAGGPTRLSKREETARIEHVLANLEEIYPDRIGEACVIDRRGVEVARVVRGSAADPAELSHNEADNPFFKAAFAMRPGQVYQSPPYVSPDTGEWVISTSTPIDTGTPRPPAIAHFEITVDSFRTQAERGGTESSVLIVDRRSGRVLVETGRPQRDHAPLGSPSTALTRLAASSAVHAPSGVVTRDGQRAAFRAVHPAYGNANSWLVVATTSQTAAPWATGPGKGALAAALGALALLASSVIGFRSNQRELRRRATTDVLTGLANRAVLQHRLSEAVKDQRHRALLLLLDLDGFKEVNDTLGHGAGDVLLCEVAARIRGALAPEDLVSRLGGDEFAMLVHSVPEGEDRIDVVLGSVLTAVRRPFVLDQVGVRIDASVGVAVLHEHGDSPELLMRHADVAMYQAKTSGGGYAVYDAATDLHSTQRLGMTAGLLEAIERRELELHYQPKVDVQTGHVVGVEALVRWTHPTLGPLSPIDFIPIAEKTGLIRPLTECVVDLALAQCRAWLDDGRSLPIAVNCSAIDLSDERLLRHVAEALDHHQLPPGMLHLEITESAIMADPDRATTVLERFHMMGVKISVDDYGTGYASLTYLKKLPVTELKIDREFIAGIVANGADATIVRSTIELGHSLGMRVVGEGVEDAASLAYLAASGCDTAQGYHLSRPLPASALAEWLDAHDYRVGTADAASAPA